VAAIALTFSTSKPPEPLRRLETNLSEWWDREGSSGDDQDDVTEAEALSGAMQVWRGWSEGTARSVAFKPSMPLGLTFSSLDVVRWPRRADGASVVVIEIASGGAAQEHGVRVGDLIVGLNRAPLPAHMDKDAFLLRLRAALEACANQGSGGQTIDLVLLSPALRS